jgi:hypothetical protein
MCVIIYVSFTGSTPFSQNFRLSLGCLGAWEKKHVAKHAGIGVWAVMWYAQLQKPKANLGLYKTHFWSAMRIYQGKLEYFTKLS